MGCNISNPSDGSDNGSHVSRCDTPYREPPVRRLYQLKEVTEGSPIKEEGPSPHNDSDNSFPLLNHVIDHASADKSHKNNSRPLSLKSVSSGDNLKKSPGGCSKDSALSSSKSSSSSYYGISNDKTQSLKSSHSSKTLRSHSAKSKDSISSVSSTGFKDKIHVLYVNSDSVEDDNKDCCDDSSLEHSTGTYTIAKEDCESPVGSIKVLGDKVLIEETSDLNKCKTSLEASQDILSLESHNVKEFENKEVIIRNNNKHKDESTTLELISHADDESKMVKEDEISINSNANKGDKYSDSHEESQLVVFSQNNEPQNVEQDDAKASPANIQDTEDQLNHLETEELQEMTGKTESTNSEIDANLNTVTQNSNTDVKNNNVPIQVQTTKEVRIFSGKRQNDYSYKRNIGSATVSISDLLSDSDSVEDLPCSLAASSSGLVLPRPITSKKKKKLLSSGSSSSIVSNYSSQLKSSTDSKSSSNFIENGLNQDYSKPDSQESRTLGTASEDNALNMGNLSTAMALNITESSSPSANWFDDASKAEAESNENIHNGNTLPEIRNENAFSCQTSVERAASQSDFPENLMEIKSMNTEDLLNLDSKKFESRISETEDIPENAESVVVVSELELDKISSNGEDKNDAADSNKDDNFSSQDQGENLVDAPNSDNTQNEINCSKTIRSDIKSDDKNNSFGDLNEKDENGMTLIVSDIHDVNSNHLNFNDIKSSPLQSSLEGYLDTSGINNCNESVINKKYSECSIISDINNESKVNNLNLISQENTFEEMNSSRTISDDDMNLKQNSELDENNCKDNIYSEKIIPSEINSLIHEENNGGEPIPQSNPITVNENKNDDIMEIVPRETHYSETLSVFENQNILTTFDESNPSSAPDLRLSFSEEEKTLEDEKESVAATQPDSVKDNSPVVVINNSDSTEISNNLLATEENFSEVEKENHNMDEIIPKETHYSEDLPPLKSQNNIPILDVQVTDSVEECNNSFTGIENVLDIEKENSNIDEVIQKETHYSEKLSLSEHQADFPIVYVHHSDSDDVCSNSFITKENFSDEEKIIDEKKSEIINESNSSSIEKQNISINEIVPRETHYSEKLTLPENEDSLPSIDINSFNSLEVCNSSLITEADILGEVTCRDSLSHNDDHFSEIINASSPPENLMSEDLSHTYEIKNTSPLTENIHLTQNEDSKKEFFQGENMDLETKDANFLIAKNENDSVNSINNCESENGVISNEEFSEKESSGSDFKTADFIENDVLIEDVTDQLCQYEEREKDTNEDFSSKTEKLYAPEDLNLGEVSLMCDSDTDLEKEHGDTKIASASELDEVNGSDNFKIEDVTDAEHNDSSKILEDSDVQNNEVSATESNDEGISSDVDPHDIAEINFFQDSMSNEECNSKVVTDTNCTRADGNINEFTHENSHSPDPLYSNVTQEKENENESENIDIDSQLNNEIELKNIQVNEESEQKNMQMSNKLVPVEESSEENESESSTEASELADSFYNDIIMKKYEIENLPEGFESPFIIPKDEMRNNFLFEQELEIISEENSLNESHSSEHVLYNSENDEVQSDYEYISKGNIIKFNPSKKVGVKDIESYENERNLDKSNPSKRAPKLTDISSLNGYEIKLVASKGENSPILGNESPERDCNSANHILIGF